MSSLGNSARRQRLWQQLTAQQGATDWDLIVIGGGIVGAGILREAASLKLKVLLLERQDFAWGTSSRSSKMVHGGLRYITSGDFRIARDSVVGRERLLQEAAGLVTPLPYLFASRRRQYPGRWAFTALLMIYDLFAGRRDHRFLDPQELALQAPHLQESGLKGACQYTDAITDDARLVLRVLVEAAEAARNSEVGVLNYVAVEELVQSSGRVAGVRARDSISGESVEIRAKVVVNATGAWADALRRQVGGEPRMRPLRGSHLVFPYHRLPVSQAVTALHPVDRRPVFIFPWEGATVVGTTDLDHREDIDREAAITREETDYLLQLVQQQFPALGLAESDVLSTWSGIRPVVSSGKLNPSAERRDHSIWTDRGLISVAGGKLTTFRLIALDVLAAVSHYLPMDNLEQQAEQPIFAPLPAPVAPFDRLLGADQRRRLLGRYGQGIVPWVLAEQACNLETIPGTHTLWTELRWAAGGEAVCHLDDLLLRRTRIGLLVKNGALEYLDRVRELVQSPLGWDDAQWSREVQRYRDIYRQYYSLPV